MEFLHLINSSSIVRLVLDNMLSENNNEDEIKESIEQLKKDLNRFDASLKNEPF